MKQNGLLPRERPVLLVQSILPDEPEVLIKSDFTSSIHSGAKAHAELRAFAARLKSRPFKARFEFF
jgi:hypothetical protein